MAQKNIVKQKVAPLTSRTMRRISAETVLETDTPRTCELKKLRIKRLAYFCDSKRSNMLSTKPALHSTSEACLESENNSKTEIQTSTACDFLQPCELRCRNERLQEVPETCPQNNVEKTASKDMVTNIIPGKEIPFIDPDYNLLEDRSVPETEKLRHVINWAQKVISRPQLENNDITNSLDFCSTVLSNKDTCRELNKERETEGHGSSLSSLQHSTSSKQAIGFPDSTLQLIQNTYLNHQGIHQGIHVDGKDRDRDCDQSSAAISNKNKADSEFHIAQPRSVAENRKRDLKNKIISSAPDGSYFWIPLEDYSDKEYAGKTKRVSENINYLEGITHNNHPVGTSFNRRNVEQFFSSSDIPLNSTPSEKLFPRNQNSRDHAWINELRNDRSGVGGSCLAENSIKSNLNNIKYEKENPQEQYINNYLSLVSDPEMQEVRPSVLGLELLAFEEKCLKDTPFQNDVHTGRTFTVRNAESSKEHNMFYNTIIATNKSLNEKQKRQECQESYPVYLKNSFILQSQDSGLLKYCPDCGSANNGMLNWCTDCECTLIGIPAQFKQINSNRDSKVMFSDGRRAINDHVKIKNEKLLKDTKYGQVEPNDMSNRSIYHQCFQDTGDVNNPSSDSESDLSMYEKYLFYKEYLNRNKTLDQGSKDTFELLPAGDHEQLKCTRYSSSDVALNTRTVCQSEQKKCIIKEKEEEPIYEQLEAPANYFSSKDTTTGCVAVNETPWDWESHRTDTELENFQQDYTAQGLYTEKQLDKAPKDSSNFLEKLLGELDFKENDTSQEHKTPKKYSKDLKPQKSKSVQPRLPGSKRYWEKSSIAWTSFTHGELKPRSQNIKRPSSADSDRKTAKEHSQKKQLKTGKTNATNSKIISNKMSASADTTAGVLCQPCDTNTSPVGAAKTTNTWMPSKHIRTDQLVDYGKLKTLVDTDLCLWLCLPDELWITIFSLLYHKDLSQVAQVCSQFRRLASDEALWRTIQIKNCHSLNDNFLISIGQHHPWSITLYRCQDETQEVTTSGVRELFRQCKDSLKELNVTSCTGHIFKGDIVLQHASAFCNHLTSVDISWTGASDNGILPLVETSDSLQNLSVNGCQITDDSITAMAKKHGKRLKSLEVFGCHALTAPCMTYMARECPNLQILNMGRLPKITDTCLAQMMSNLKSLRSLNVTGLTVIRDRVLHHIVRQCPKLERLTISSCPLLTDVSLIEISTYLQTIQYLDVSGCKKVTDTGVQALAMSCHQLQYLDLSSTETGHRGVCLLASYCKNLECVKLSFCKEISQDAVKKLCKSCIKLKLLHLYGCRTMYDLKAIKDTNKNVKVHHDLSVHSSHQA